MDEEDREDFFRLKRVTDKKKEDKAAAVRERELKGAAGKADRAGEETSDSIFGNEEEEEGILF